MQATTTPSPTPTHTPAAQAAGQKGGLPGSPNPDVRAAVLKDLYKVKPTGGAAEERKQARTLGLGFLVFFGVIFGGLSLSMNGLMPVSRAKERVITLHTDAGDPCGCSPMQGLLLDEKEKTWKLPPAGTPVSFDFAGTKATGTVLTPEAASERPAAGKERVRVFLDRKNIGSFEAEAPGGKTHTVTQVSLVDGQTKHTRAAAEHAWYEARLAKVVPTRYAIILGVVMGALGLLVPAALVPFFHLWMRFVAAPLGWFNTRLILGIVFFLILTPMAIVARLFGKGRLSLKPRAQGESYWRKRDQQRGRDHFERTF